MSMLRAGVVVGCLAMLVGCGGGGSGPSIQPLENQVASVGVELTIQVRAVDDDGDSLRFDFVAPGIPDLKTRPNKATITSFADGVANFRWTPVAADRSDTPYSFDFIVSDGSHTATETIEITVRDAGGEGSPIFRQPLGTGTTLDLGTDDCLEINILVEDSDSPMVTIEQLDPLIEGAELLASGPFGATFSWCPTAEQVAAQDRYMLVLSADDGNSPATTKPYLIVLRTPPKPNCPGTGPVVTHTAPAAQSTVQDLDISAMVVDDLGLKSAPLLYYATTAPANPPVLTAMTQVTMTRTAGDMRSGTWKGVVPNPVAAMPTGSMKTLYYIIAANDNDDPNGTCDHTTQAPMTGTFSFAVTNPGTAGTTPICKSCSSDTQCGDADDNCVRIGSMGLSYCSQSCGDAASPACPTDYTCSANAMLSVDGQSKRQCVPAAGTCTPMMMTMCTDDALEQNDGQTSITNAMSMNLSAGVHANLAFCPAGQSAADEDWYRIPITADAMITVKLDVLSGSGFSDIDLQLRAAPSGTTQGRVLRYSYSTGAVETVSHCAQASDGDVYARVFTLDAPPVLENLYDLTLTKTPMSCCTDANEPDNNKTQAENITPVPLSPTVKRYTGLKICTSMDEDWYKIALPENKKVVIDLTMMLPTAGTTTGPAEDLDIHLFKTDAAAPGGVRDLTPCSTVEFDCQYTNGQGSNKAEHMEYTVPAGMADTYYIVVKPYDSGTNNYDLAVTVQ